MGETRRVDPGRTRDIGVEDPREEASFIHVRLRYEQQRAINSMDLYDLHNAYPSVGAVPPVSLQCNLPDK